VEANAAAAGISVTVTGMMLSGFTAFLPTLREVRQGSPTDPRMVNDVRYGQLAAGVMAVGIGALMAWLSNSSVPLYVAIFATLLYATIYEMALRNTGA
jgi:hypothetical protein